MGSLRVDGCRGTSYLAAVRLRLVAYYLVGPTSLIYRRDHQSTRPSDSVAITTC